MINRTFDDIENFAKKTWDTCGVTVREYMNKIVIRIVSVDTPVPVTFVKLENLSKFLDTKNISFSSVNHDGDCSTCDFGSTYELKITFNI